MQRAEDAYSLAKQSKEVKYCESERNEKAKRVDGDTDMDADGKQERKRQKTAAYKGMTPYTIQVEKDYFSC